VEALNITSEEYKQIQNGDVHESKHCKQAREESVKTQMNHKKCCNKTAKLLVNGDKVSVLLPTASDKLLFQWKGPAVVTERRGPVNYRVKFESGEEKTFHMLKKYNEREDSVEASTNMALENNGQFTNRRVKQ